MGGQATGLGDIGESQGPGAGCGDQLVAVEPVTEGERVAGLEEHVFERLAGTEKAPLDQVGIQVAVAVIVEKCSPGSHHLDEVVLAGHAVEVMELQTGGGRQVFEDGVRALGPERAREPE